MKKLWATILTMVMLLPTTALAENDEIKVYVDGKQIEFDVQPIIENDVTLVPMRAIFEALNCEVDYNEFKPTDGVLGDILKRVSAKKTYDDGTDKISEQIAIYIGQTRMEKSTEKHDYIYIADTIELDVPAQIVNDRTLVPLRAVSEAFDCDVQWNGDTKTVTITSAGQNYVEQEAVETSVLDDRLIISTAGMNISQSVFSGITFTSDDTGNYKDYINLYPKELYCKSSGSLEQDVINYAMSVSGEIQKQNGLEYVEMKSDKDINVRNYSKNYMVKTSDDFLISLLFTKGTGTYLEKFETDVDDIMATIKEGDKKIALSAGETTLLNFVIDKPEGYAAYVEFGADFNVYRITKPVTSDKDTTSSLSIYEGGWPSYDEEYNGKKAIKTVQGDFLGNKITWQLYEEDNYMQAFYNADDYWCYHIFAYAESSEEQKEFINLISNIEKVKMNE